MVIRGVLIKYGVRIKRARNAKLTMIYTTPRAPVKVNGVFSDHIAISNGTQQGCPLSPLLLALTLEPFLGTCVGSD